MNTRSLISRTLGLLLMAGGLLNAADQFTYSGFTFNQTSTPNVGGLLGDSNVYGGVTFSGSLPDATTSTIQFPHATGFNTNLGLNHLVALNANTLRAVQLPKGNNGTTNRHGIEVGWTGGRGLPNSPGSDFVIYESGSTNAPEGLMVRVRTNAAPNLWTDWFYFPADAQQTTDAPAKEVAFSYGIDLSDLGVVANAMIDLIQMANLNEADRISTASPIDIGGGILVGSGKVVFDNSTSVRPDVGTVGTNRVYATDRFDPDPFYVAALHDTCEAVAPTLTTTRSGNSLLLSWPAPSCYSLESATNLVTGSWSSVPESFVLTNGTKRVTVSMQDGTGKFFRLLKP